MQVAKRLLAGVVVMAGFMSACRGPEAEMLPVRTITLQGPSGISLPVKAEVAGDEASRAKGLMFRTTLPEGTGMVFIWPEASVRKFWMRNTLIPLDMLFFREGVLVGLVAWAKPHDETPVGPDVPVDMVLEVPAGYSTKHGIMAGWRLDMQQRP